MSKEMSEENVMLLAIASTAMHGMLSASNGGVYPAKELARASFDQAQAMVDEAKARGIK